MATKRQNLRKELNNINSSETVWGIKMKLCRIVSNISLYKRIIFIATAQVLGLTSRKLLRIKVTPDLHLTYSRNGGNLGLVLKMNNIACISILLTKHVKYTYLFLFKFVLYSIVAFKAY